MIINMNEDNVIACGNRGHHLTLAFVAKDKLPKQPEAGLTDEYMDLVFQICDEQGVSINFTTVEQINHVFMAVAGELKKREEAAQ